MGCVSSRILPDEDTHKPIKKHDNPSIITGDITQKNEARFEREKAMKLRQKERITAAEEISLRALDEKDRLSLGTRSRGTSRVSSRAGSPAPAGRKVHFKAESKVENKNQKNQSDQPSTDNVQYNHNLENGDIGANEKGKSKKNKNRKNTVQPIRDKSDSNGPIISNNNNEGTIKGVNQSEILSTIDERASSRNSGKSEEARR